MDGCVAISVTPDDLLDRERSRRKVRRTVGGVHTPREGFKEGTRALTSACVGSRCRYISGNSVLRMFLKDGRRKDDHL